MQTVMSATKTLQKEQTKYGGLKIPRLFSREGQSPYDQFMYDLRSSVIRNPDGSVVFQANDIQVPKGWSQVATDILAQKYLRRAGVILFNEEGEPLVDESGRQVTGAETSIKQVAHRLAGCWRYWGEQFGYFQSERDAQIFYDELAYMLVAQIAAPNSPQWFNTGLNWAYGITGPAQGHWYTDAKTGITKLSEDAYTRPTPHACAEYFTQVYTKNGTKFIGEIVENDEKGLSVFDGERFVDILATKYNGQKDVFRITLKNGNYLDLTEDHLVWSAPKRRKEGGVYDWTYVKDLAIGMKLQQPNVNLVEEKNVFTEDLARARLAGWVIGDGAVGIYDDVMRMEIITINEDEHQAVLEDVKEVFGEDVSYWITSFETQDTSLQGKRIHLSGKKLFPFIGEYGLLNKKSGTVEVPLKILRGAPQEKREFLKSLFQADGCVRIRVERKGGDICLTTISKDLAFGVLQLLNSLGIYARISEEHDKREDRSDPYQIVIAYRSAREQYQEQIGFISGQKQQKLLELNALVFKGKSLPLIREETIVSIEQIGIKDVYDIQTESGKFLANGVVVHNCFIQSVSDDLVNEGGIFDLVLREARIFKYGSGTGSNFSNLRGRGEKLGGGGTSSGLMSFLKVNDVAAGSVKSGGTTRRAAKMVCLDMDHPEIEEFIMWKVREEQKVANLVTGSKNMKKTLTEVINAAKAGGSDRKANHQLASAIKEAVKVKVPLKYVLRAISLVEQGKETDLVLMDMDTHYESDAYNTVSGQNSNNSVRIPNAFFEAVEKGSDWKLIKRTDKAVFKTLSARKLWDQIGYAAWACADPGTQDDTTLNEWHTCPVDGRINASNPCVTGDTLVLTQGGKWAQIKDLVGKETVILTNMGGIIPSRIAGAFSTGKKPVYTMTTSCGYELKLTADHKVFTLTRGFVPACELTQDDRVLIPAAEVADIKDPEDPMFYRLIGLYLGDGYGNDQSIQITMDKDTEQGVLESVASYVAENYERQTHKCSPATVTIRETSAAYVIDNSLLKQRMAGVVDFSLRSHQERIPQQVFEAGLGAQKYVLQGLFTADGTVADYGEKCQYVALDSSSLQLLKDVQLLLLGFGIKSKIYTDRRAGKDTALLPDGKGGVKQYPVKETHSLRISRSGRMAFERLIGFMEESPKQRRLKELNRRVGSYKDYPIDAVKSLVYAGEEEVFDLTEHLTHSFVANGMTVHNCGEYNFLDDTACNLASINLAKFYDTESGVFDLEGYKHAIRLWTVVLEISVLMAQFPSRSIAEKSYLFRTLGLGYANLGSVLMTMGIPYDSEEARAISGALTATLCGESYATSAEIAKHLGPFESFGPNRDNMLRVMRNHRRAAYNAKPEEYEGLTIKPQGIKEQYCPPDFLACARDAWDRALEMGSAFGYRNAQVTVLAPTGTIGLVMDCDTTGVEPDFALVKFKKLSGGGYFKIANQSVPAALKHLGYMPQESEDIVKFMVGHGSLKDSPHINHASLRAKGLTQAQLDAIDAQAGSAFDLKFLFNKWTLGEDFCKKDLGLTSEQLVSPNLDLLATMGFTKQQIDEANDYICGNMTLEGAPLLKDEHLAVFDCANACGKKGKRYIHHMGHIKMMAAAQPFISGAISKTINMPESCTIKEVQEAYLTAWKLMNKAIALYRDGCKLSQPLSSTVDIVDEVDETVGPAQLHQETAQVLKLPSRRSGFVQEATVGGQEVVVRTSEFADGSLAEVDIDIFKDGSTMNMVMKCFAKVVSKALQAGVPLNDLVEEFTFTKFEPHGMVYGHDAIKNSTSVVDYVFRTLGYEYLGRDDFTHVKKSGASGYPSPTLTSPSSSTLKVAEEGIKISTKTSPIAKGSGKDKYKAMGYTGDSCGACSSMKVKRNGACTLCDDCGATSGCS